MQSAKVKGENQDNRQFRHPLRCHPESILSAGKNLALAAQDKLREGSRPAHFSAFATLHVSRHCSSAFPARHSSLVTPLGTGPLKTF